MIYFLQTYEPFTSTEEAIILSSDSYSNIMTVTPLPLPLLIINRLIFMTGIHMLLRRYLYFETIPWFPPELNCKYRIISQSSIRPDACLHAEWSLNLISLSPLSCYNRRYKGRYNFVWHIYFGVAFVLEISEPFNCPLWARASTF